MVVEIYIYNSLLLCSLKKLSPEILYILFTCKSFVSEFKTGDENNWWRGGREKKTISVLLCGNAQFLGGKQDFWKRMQNFHKQIAKLFREYQNFAIERKASWRNAKLLRENVKIFWEIKKVLQVNAKVIGENQKNCKWIQNLWENAILLR